MCFEKFFHEVWEFITSGIENSEIKIVEIELRIYWYWIQITSIMKKFVDEIAVDIYSEFCSCVIVFEAIIYTCLFALNATPHHCESRKRDEKLRIERTNNVVLHIFNILS